MSPFKQFDCKLKWRMYNDQSAIDYDVKFNSILSLYKVRQEYDLRFFCSSNSCKLIYSEYHFRNNCFNVK
jgi:hypothetical protein